MAITPVQFKQADVGASSQNITFTSNNTAGNILIIGVESNGASAISVSDSRNSYAPAASIYTASGTSLQIYYAANCGAGANIVNISTTGGTYITTVISEFTGIATALPLDGSGARNTGSSTSAASGNYTVTTGDLVIGLICFQQGSIVVGSGFASLGTDTFAMLEYQVISGTTANAIATGTTGTWLAQGVAFKAASGSGGLQGQILGNVIFDLDADGFPIAELQTGTNA